MASGPGAYNAVHEFSIVQSILDVAIAEAERAGVSRVLRIHCRIGTLRGVEDQLMTEAFELLRPGTLCADAALCIEKAYLQARCDQCDKVFSVRDWIWQCPDCGADGVNVGGGDELELTSIEAEAPD